MGCLHLDAVHVELTTRRLGSARATDKLHALSEAKLKTLIEICACPDCYSSLESDAGGLICTGCRAGARVALDIAIEYLVHIPTDAGVLAARPGPP